MKTILFILATLGACDQPQRLPADSACYPGEVVTNVGEPTPCDLIGGVNTLTIVGTTADECDWHGGVYADSVCRNADF